MNVKCFYVQPMKQRMTTKRKQTGKTFFLSFCSLCFYSIFHPFSPNSSRRDGRTFSLLYLISLTTIGVVLNLSRWIQSESQSRMNIVTNDQISGFLMTCIVPSLIWMMYYTVKTPTKATVEFLDSSVCHQEFFICGVYIFGGGSILLCVLQISFFCQTRTEIISLILAILCVLFIIVQMIFLRKYSKASFQDDSFIRTALFHLLSTNVMFLCHRLPFHDIPKNRVASLSSIANMLNHCYPYLYPFLVQFPLSSLGAIFRLLCDLKELDPKPDDIYIDDELTDINTVNSPILEKGENIFQLEQYVKKSASPFNVLESPRTIHGSVLIQQSRFDTMKRCLGLGFLLCLILSSFFLAVIIITSVQKSPFTVSIFYIAKIVYLLSACISCWLILKGLLSQKNVWFDFSAPDFMLFFSVTAVLFYEGFTLMASIAQIHISILPKYVFTLSFVDIIQCLLQTSTVARALRFRNGYQGGLVREASLFLMFCNIILWLQRSFLFLQTPFLSLVQDKFYSEASWNIISFLTYPCNLFFRFHSAVCLYNVWSLFNNK